MKKFMVVIIFNRSLIDAKVFDSLDEANEYMANDYEKYNKEQNYYGDWEICPKKCAWASVNEDSCDWYIIPIE